MKKNYLHLLFSFLAIGLIVGSCSMEENIFDSEFEIITRNNSLESNWKEKLQYVMNGEGAVKLANQGIKLIGFRHSNLSPEAYIKESMDENSIVPFYNDSININDFTLLKISMINKDKETYFNRKKAIIDSSISSENDFLIVELLWNYNEEEFATNALVSDKEIIYDDILSNITYYSIEERENSSDLISFPQIKTRSESGSGMAVYMFSSPSQREYSIWDNEVVAEAYVIVKITGNKYSDMSKSIEQYDAKGYYSSKSGYSAFADVKMTNFRTGLNGCAEYSYVQAVSRSSSLSIGWNGTGFTMPGGTNGITHSTYVIPANLR